MRFMWFDIIVSIPLHGQIGETMPGSSRPSIPNGEETFVILAALNLLLSQGFCGTDIPPSGAIRSRPEYIHAVKRWTSSWTIPLSVHRKF